MCQALYQALGHESEQVTGPAPIKLTLKWEMERSKQATIIQQDTGHLRDKYLTGMALNAG